MKTATATGGDGPRLLDRVRDEARALQHDWMGTQHLLLALLARPSETLREVFRRVRLDPVAARAKILGPMTPGPVPVSSRQLPVTPSLKHVLDASLEEAKAVGASDLGDEHLLLASIRVRDAGAGRALEALGVDLEEARRAVRAVYETRPPPGR